MNIGIDITSLIYKRGVSRYTSNLLRELNKDNQLKLKLYGTSLRQKSWLENTAQLTADKASVAIQAYPVGLNSKLWKTGLNKVGKQLGKLDLFHAWEWQLPPDKNLPLVVTIHDLAMLRYPEQSQPKALKAHKYLWKQIQSKPIHLIAVSHTTKKDLVELLQIDPDRIRTIHEALPQETTQAASHLTEEVVSKLLSFLPSQKPFLLFVGSWEPRKNLERLIEAWQSLAKDYSLVIAGASGKDQHNVLSKFKYQPTMLGKVTDLQLAALYSNATALVFPSLYEGFGLPILEAFHFGLPVITSHHSGMAEVAGTAAELVDPLQVESIRAGIVKILSETTQEQQLRAQKMIVRQHAFSWSQAGEQTIDYYHSILS